MLKHLLQTLLLSAALCNATETDSIPILDLDIISYDDFMNEDPATLRLLDKALHEKGIVGMRGIPTYQEKVLNYIDAARRFSALPEEVKEAYAPNRKRGDLFLGYERGKEKFKRPDGKWVIDDLKVSYYAFVPDCPVNRWPAEVDLRTPFQEIASLMAKIGEVVMHKIGLTGPSTGIYVNDIPRIGRALQYRHNTEDLSDNPYWCGSHFDLSVLTTLLPAFYFLNGEPIAEPPEAGLFVKTTQEGVFKKVAANDPDILLFQVGEFGQLATNDAIRATEHRVHKATAAVERYTLALFTDAPMDTVIYSTSELTKDSRYGGEAGTPCSYRHWFEESFKRYLLKKKKKIKRLDMAALTNVAFPDQQTIRNYIQNHPLKGCIEVLPIPFQKIDVIAAAFANQVISRKEIRKNIREAFQIINQEALEMKCLIQKRIEERHQSGDNTTYFTGLLEELPKLEEDAYYLPEKVYKIFLKDLIDKKNFSSADTITDHNLRMFFGILRK